jgi:hypothetical protein
MELVIVGRFADGVREWLRRAIDPTKRMPLDNNCEVESRKARVLA